MNPPMPSRCPPGPFTCPASSNGERESSCSTFANGDNSNDVGVAVRGEVRVRILERAVVGMVPLLGGALCACTWHFFYNSESLEVLVALQAALTVIGNATMCIAAYRIYRSSERSKNL
ncbi:hypothetical protein C1H46_001766 [Malus baccata]|uniref:Uncharacterized protein n=1 Tax=Malus baccata TaxID=106549 RepID=A0A540NNE7_MALBA|nr:hypothetical protein C1H46_001766 [Malus baccata]